MCMEGSGTSTIRSTLSAKPRDELNVIARRLRITGYRRLTKADLIAKLLVVDETALGRCLNVTWWDRYQNHVYGLASVFGVILTIAFYLAEIDFGRTGSRIQSQELTHE